MRATKWLSNDNNGEDYPTTATKRLTNYNNKED